MSAPAPRAPSREVVDVHTLWARAAELAGTNRRLRKLASEIEAVELREDAIVLEADAEHFAMAEGSLAELAELVGRAGERCLTIELRRAAARPTAAPASPATNPLADAAEIPAVRRAMQLFNAQVRTVQQRARPGSARPPAEDEPPAE